MSMRKRKRKEWEEFSSLLKNRTRITNFDEAYSSVSVVCGLYKKEAESVWLFLKEINPRSIVEIGRCLGGSFWLFGCACDNLERSLSIDILEYEVTDNNLKEWYEYYGVECDVLVCDSKSWKEDRMWDFVFIDGGHDEPTVKADIEVWKDKCKYIGFHDFSDRGRKNCHKKPFPDLVEVVSESAEKYGWVQFWDRGKSEIIFKTRGNI